MIVELITKSMPALVVLVILTPMAAFLAAMLFEGARKDRWGEVRQAARQTGS